MTSTRIFTYDATNPAYPDVLGKLELRRGQVFKPLTAVPRCHGGILTWHVTAGIQEVEGLGTSKFNVVQRRLWGTRGRVRLLKYAPQDSIMATPAIGLLAQVFDGGERPPLHTGQRVDLFWSPETSRVAALGNPLTGQAAVM